MEVTVTLEEDPTDAEMEVFDALRVFNESHVGDSGLRRVVLFARDGNGEVIGGLRGMTAWRWLHVTILVVKEAYRRQGIGTRLLEEAERVAALRDCIGIHIETTSFQAMPFYDKKGYTVFGILEDCPPGHKCYFLKKILG